MGVRESQRVSIGRRVLHGCTLWAAGAALAAAAISAQAQTRGVALVIGNSAYGSPLANPANDAGDVGAALREAGFEVVIKTDVAEGPMKEALADFEDRLRATRGVGIFYFAGHGMQTNNGRNYLLPVGRNYQRERDVELYAIAADTVLARMEKVGNPLNIVILDACRDAPLPAQTRGSASRGLARMDAPSGSVIAFATAPGRTASDNPGRRNGLYTYHLLRALRMPGLRLEDVFKEVGRAVEKDSGGEQSPEEFMKLRDLTPFCFFPGRGCGPARYIQTAEEVEQETWDVIKASRDVRDFRDYLQRYPAGRFAVIAQQRLRSLEPTTLPTPTNTPPPETTVAIGRPVQPPPTLPQVASPGPVVQKVTYAADVFFDFDKGVLKPEAKAKLDDLAGKIGGVSLEVVIAVGHTSGDEGTGQNALKFSERRSEAVKAYLASKGIEQNRIYVEGKGSKQPVADNATAEGRAKNRRVEIEVVGTRPVR